MTIDPHAIDPHAIAAEMIRDRIGRSDIEYHLEEAGHYVYDGITVQDILDAVRSATMLAGWPDVPSLLVRVDRYHRLVAAEADLLDVRGILSPQGHPAPVPMELGETVARAVRWLADEVARLREQLAAQEPVITAAHSWAEVFDAEDLTPARARRADAALRSAVDQHRLIELAVAAGEREHAEGGEGR